MATFEDLEEAEAFVFSLRAMQIEQGTYPLHSFTLTDFKQLHYHLFQDIYPFAGIFRDVQLMKGTTRFCQFQFIEQYAEQLFFELSHEPDWPTIEVAAKRLAHFKSELNMLHPFREGNGRSIRIFLEKYAKTKRIRWHYGNMNREQYIEAMIRAQAHTDILERIFLDTIEFF